MAVAVPAAGAAALLAIDIAQTVLIQIIGQLVSTTISAVLAPEFEGLTVDAYGTIEFRGGSPPTPLSAAQAADAVVRGYLTQLAGAAEAKFTGYNADRFKIMVDSTGEPLPLQSLTEAWRRKIIAQAGLGAESTSLEQGIRESRVKDKWIKVVEALQFMLAPPGVVIEGWLRAQITEAEARAILYQNGIDDATATLMYKSAGRPPAPQELIELWRRGVIPESGTGGDAISVDQGYLETDLKNKWLPVWKRLRDYLPPPRTITALLRDGSLTEAQALDLFEKSGLPADLAAVYVADAHHARTAASRDLTKATIIELYEEGWFSRADALTHLTGLGETAEVAGFEIEAADWRRTKTLVDHAVTRLHTLYIGHRISDQDIVSELGGLNIPSEQVSAILQVWALERAANVKVLSTAQVLDLLSLGMPSTDVSALLQQDGYSATDADYLIRIKLKVGLASPLPQ